jgi:peptidyl-prolyl cis-trans isomerase B (cyclophilin B)
VASVRLVIRLPLVLIALLAVFVVAGCGDDSDSGDGNSDTSAKSGECADVEAPAPKPDGGATEPEDLLDAAQSPRVTFQTSCGDFTVTLDPKDAPDATTSFYELARTGFYDDTTFHRIVPKFVIQGGDPTGKGDGGPGYATFDRLPPTATYSRGVVAMAKAPTDPAGAAGSQFFVVTAPDAGLPPDYAIVGKVTAGMGTVKRIEALGGPDEQPQRPVVVEKTTVDRS